MNLPVHAYNSSEHQNQNNSPESSCDSSCCSCCSDSDGSILEWDSSIQQNGELVYIKCSPRILDSYTDETISKISVTQTKSNKFSSFLRKRKQKKHISPKENAEVKIDSSKIYPEIHDLSEQNVSVVFLNLATIENRDSTSTNDMYYFPQSAEKNVINVIKGALLTLYHLMPKLISETPESSTVLIKEELVHIVYLAEEDDLLILACPDSRCSIFQLKLLGLTIKHCLDFKYRSLRECFFNQTNHANLNQLFGNLFIKLLRNSVDDIHGAKLMTKTECQYTQFEKTFMLPPSLTVNGNLKARIEQKLNKLEANDFGDLSEDHYGCQRLFTIIGTCLYSNGFLISSHLERDDLVDIYSYLQLNDILDLSVSSKMESLVIWQEVYLSSFLKNKNNSLLETANRRWFMLITGKEQCLLVSLLETGGCALNQIGPCRPDELYVEQIQDTLSNILQLGLSDATDRYSRYSSSSSNSPNKSQPPKSVDSSQNTLPLYPTLRRSVEFPTSSNFENENSFEPASVNQDDTFSESLSRTTSSVFSDDAVPVLGRRAQRLQLNNISSTSIYTLSQSNESDSDHSDFETTESSQSSSFIENKKGSRSTPISKKKTVDNDKSFFYYVTLHSNRGVILYSENPAKSYNTRKWYDVINNFRLTAQKIHTVLGQKKTPSIGKFQRNSLPVKEYGLLFEYHPNEDENKDRKSNPITYWVVGRTFNKPQLGEVYVCYEDKTPQNMVEIAFRLAMSS